MISLKKLLGFITLMFFAVSTQANSNKLPLPRFASIKSNEVNARSGPSIKAPVEWVFVKKYEPVEIIAEYEQWRQIRDIKGEGGWVHSSVLSGKRSVVSLGKDVINLIKDPSDTKQVLAKVSPSVRCQLHKCKETWCKVTCQTLTGWLPVEKLWGVYPNEKF